MRAMHKIAYAWLALVLVACSSTGNNNGGQDLSVPADLSMAAQDLSVPRDMTAHMVGPPNGVACGGSTCNVGTTCCIPVSDPTSATCTMDGGMCSSTGTIPLACDGPEDCNNGQGKPACCGTVQIAGGSGDAGGAMLAGGMASCTATCNVAFVPGGGGVTITSQLCHVAADCVGLSGTLPVIGMTNFDSCCSSAAAGGIAFCGPSLLNGQMGVTCN
jgi:hypothetical protein